MSDCDQDTGEREDGEWNDDRPDEDEAREEREQRERRAAIREVNPDYWEVI